LLVSTDAKAVDWLYIFINALGSLRCDTHWLLHKVSSPSPQKIPEQEC